MDDVAANTDKIFRLVYVSVATRPFSDGELLDVLRIARQRNLAYGVTGMLLYRDGDFMQLLEGEEPAVRDVYGVIAGDTRHRNLVVLLEEFADDRLFADWSMGFHRLPPDSMDSAPGYTNFLDDSLRSERFARSPHECLNLLGLFDSMF
jgi:hypothetical protein